MLQSELAKLAGQVAVGRGGSFVDFLSVLVLNLSVRVACLVGMGSARMLAAKKKAVKRRAVGSFMVVGMDVYLSNERIKTVYMRLRYRSGCLVRRSSFSWFYKRGIAMS